MTSAVRDAPALELPRQPGAIRGLMRRHPAAVDRFIAASYLLGTAALAILGRLLLREVEESPGTESIDYLSWPHILLGLLVSSVTTAALLLRRRFPLSSLIAVVAVVVIAPDDMLLNAGATVAAWVLLYSVPVYRSPKAGWVGYAIAVLSSLIPVPSLIGDPLTADVTGPGGTVAVAVLSVTITSALLMLIPVVIGINIGNRNRYTDAIIDRAHQLARERDQRARLAVAEERSRIAREMHDIIAHSVSVMIMLSEGASRAAESHPQEASTAMSQCAEMGRSALAEMRRLIGALREPESAAESAELAPAPGVEALPELIDGFRAAGLRVDLTLKGAPRAAARAGDQGRELAVYRTVQEALTNTLRYAGPGAAAEVVVAQRDGATIVSVTDDGGLPGQPAPMPGVGSGQGLIGLAERMRVFGGELEYGPTGAGGWRVAATLPDDEQADEVDSASTVIEYGNEERDE